MAIEIHFDTMDGVKVYAFDADKVETLRDSSHVVLTRNREVVARLNPDKILFMADMPEEEFLNDGTESTGQP